MDFLNFFKKKDGSISVTSSILIISPRFTISTRSLFKIRVGSFKPLASRRPIILSASLTADTFYDLVDVVEGNCRLKQALIKDKRYNGLFLLPLVVVLPTPPFPLVITITSLMYTIQWFIFITCCTNKRQRRCFSWANAKTLWKLKRRRIWFCQHHLFHLL